MSRAGLDKQASDVATMFDAVARRYDITNDVLSVGQDRRWRRRVVKLVNPQPDEVILDLAAGTGTSSSPFASAGAFVVPCDFSLGMLRVGKANLPGLAFTAGDALALPFEDSAFDAVTISFGLRNVADPVAALAEMCRVTRPGGRIVVCEFSRPTWRPFATVYTNYLMAALPAIARVVSSNPESYVYLAESIRAWPDQIALATQMARAGWGSSPHAGRAEQRARQRIPPGGSARGARPMPTAYSGDLGTTNRQIRWQNVSGGIVALHYAVKPNG